MKDETIYSEENVNHKISDIDYFISIYDDGVIEVKKEKNNINIEFSDGAELDLYKHFGLEYKNSGTGRCNVSLRYDENVLILNLDEPIVIKPLKHFLKCLDKDLQKISDYDSDVEIIRARFI